MIKPLGQIITEEVMQEWFEENRSLPDAVSDYRIKMLIGSNRALSKENAELRDRIHGELEVSEQVVQEREELILEIERLQKAVEISAKFLGQINKAVNEDKIPNIFYGTRLELTEALKPKPIEEGETQ